VTGSVEIPIIRAAERHAAAGRYAAAVALLDTLPGGKASQQSAALLRAKIAAQQGRFDEAVGHWRGVLATAPDHTEARAGIARAERVKQRPRFLMRWRLHAAALGLAALALGVATAAGAFESAPPDPSLAAIAGVVDRQTKSEAQILAEIRTLTERLQVTETLQRDASTAITQDLGRARRQLTNVQRDLNRLRQTLDKPLQP
jgi:hypothetical protein